MRARETKMSTATEKKGACGVIIKLTTIVALNVLYGGMKLGGHIGEEVLKVVKVLDLNRSRKGHE